MTTRALTLAFALSLSLGVAGPGSVAHARPLRILSVDQCADQYALALAPDQDLRLSKRADDPDSWMRTSAQRHRQVRPSLEQAVMFRPDVVLRTWGGDPRLIDRLQAQGARVVTLSDARDFEGAEANLRLAGQVLGQDHRAARLAALMRGQLASAPAPRGPALYLTAGGFTAGPGTFVDAMLTRSGFRNAERSPGFRALSVERLVLDPPRRLILGFFDLVRSDRRGAGRHPVLRRGLEHRDVPLPAAVLTCPAWFAAEAVVDLKSAP